jgi:hypothetical protein
MLSREAFFVISSTGKLRLVVPLKVRASSETRINQWSWGIPSAPSTGKALQATGAMLLVLGFSTPAGAHCEVGHWIFVATLSVDYPCVTDKLSRSPA